MSEKKEELSEEEIFDKQAKLAEDFAIKSGYINIVRKIENKEFEIKEENYLKVNLPDTKSKFESGNGEGCWAVPYEEKDMDVLLDSDYGNTYQVVLLNTSIFFPFVYGDVLTVKTRGQYRPVLDYDFLKQSIHNATEGKQNIDDVLGQ